MAVGPIVIANRSLVRQAYEMGKEAKWALGLRVSPFYNERVLIRGQRVDITPLLDTFFFAGFDGEPYPEQPDAVDTETSPLPAVEIQPAQARAEAVDEGRAAPGSPAGAREERPAAPGNAAPVAGKVTHGEVSAEGN